MLLVHVQTVLIKPASGGRNPVPFPSAKRASMQKVYVQGILHLGNDNKPILCDKKTTNTKRKDWCVGVGTFCWGQTLQASPFAAGRTVCPPRSANCSHSGWISSTLAWVMSFSQFCCAVSPTRCHASGSSGSSPTEASFRMRSGEGRRADSCPAPYRL